jgi:hypothetical protein
MTGASLNVPSCCPFLKAGTEAPPVYAGGLVAKDTPPGSKCIVPAAPCFKLDPAIPAVDRCAMAVPPRYDSPAILLTRTFRRLQYLDIVNGFGAMVGMRDDGSHTFGNHSARPVSTGG